jgi:hypothetical protein
MTWLKTHQQKMLEHFLYLRSKDKVYAHHALKVYDKELLYPTIEKDVTAAWKNLTASKGTMSAKE